MSRTRTPWQCQVGNTASERPRTRATTTYLVRRGTAGSGLHASQRNEPTPRLMHAGEPDRSTPAGLRLMPAPLDLCVNSRSVRGRQRRHTEPGIPLWSFNGIPLGVSRSRFVGQNQYPKRIHEVGNFVSTYMHSKGTKSETSLPKKGVTLETLMV